MTRIHDTKPLQPYRKHLRNNMTDEERILWSCLKNKKMGVQFYRQHSIAQYVVDFYCPARKLIIELDGVHHLDKKEYDDARTNYLKYLGYNVIRFWNKEVRNNLVGIWKCIEEELRE